MSITWPSLASAPLTSACFNARRPAANDDKVQQSVNLFLALPQQGRLLDAAEKRAACQSDSSSNALHNR